MPAQNLFPAAGTKTLIMGVMNLTPDSFFDGGAVQGIEAAVERAMQMTADGADIIDIGGESTRPKAEPVPADEECRRVLPVLEALAGQSMVISIDTYHAKTAREAVLRGAKMINDIGALRLDPDMAEVVAESGCPYVLMHMQGTPQTMQDNPEYADVIDDICAFFEERMAFAIGHGIREEAIWLDPGFGFGKTARHNLEMLRRLREFTKFGRPILVGTSNKGTIGAVLGTTVGDRIEGTAATVTAAILNGAGCVRVHDVKAMGRVAKMTDAIKFGVGVK